MIHLKAIVKFEVKGKIKPRWGLVEDIAEIVESIYLEHKKLRKYTVLELNSNNVRYDIGGDDIIEYYNNPITYISIFEQLEELENS